MKAQTFLTHKTSMYRFVLLTVASTFLVIISNAQERRFGRPGSQSPQSQSPAISNPVTERPNRVFRSPQSNSSQTPEMNREPAQRPNRVLRKPQNDLQPVPVIRPKSNHSRPFSSNNTVNNNRNSNERVATTNRFNQGRPRPVYNPSNPGWRYANLPRRNTVITRFSYPYSTIYYGGYNYRYCDGVYYRPYNNYYRVVAPPFGMYINTLPFGYSPFQYNNNPYYYYNGTFYDQYQSNYRVVAPPLGAIVESIPEGYETIVINGETYYKVDDVQYKPVLQENGEIWYEVIKAG